MSLFGKITSGLAVAALAGSPPGVVKTFGLWVVLGQRACSGA